MTQAKYHLLMKSVQAAIAPRSGQLKSDRQISQWRQTL
ncbi:hypothetical protein NIES2104_09280 [Leptolyngbya sp. NIES-2104]|nr:hypothetical protein NIES2104_09280 [Leptolyngbya sp. NIES-2104]